MASLGISMKNAKEKKKSSDRLMRDKRHTMLYTMRLFSGRLRVSTLGEALSSANQKSSSLSGSDEDVPSKPLLVSICLWDESLKYFPFTKNIKSTNPTILKFLYLLSEPEKYEGIIQQRSCIFDILEDMFGFSLKFNCDYLLLLIDYMCDCEFDPRNASGDHTVFSVVESAHTQSIDYWNTSVLKTVRPKGKTLLSYHPKVGSFLDWLALEVSLEGGVLHQDPSFQVSSVITELIVTINDVLDTYGDAAIIRQFLSHISQQPRCFYLEIVTKTKHRMLHVYVAAGRQLKTLWSSFDMDDYFNCEQPNFALLIDDVVDHVMSNSISQDEGKELLHTTLNEMYELIENSLDAVSISDLLNFFLEEKIQAQKSSSSRVAAWLRFLKTIYGHWIILTEKWREFTDGVTQLSLTVSPQSLMFLRKYFMLFVTNGFSDPQHKHLNCGVRQIMAVCRVGKLVDNCKFNDIIQNIFDDDWTKHEDTSQLFHKLENMEQLKTLDNLIPSFRATRLG